MFKTVKMTTGAKYFNVCQKPQLRSAFEQRGGDNLGAPGLTHQLNFTAVYCSATMGIQRLNVPCSRLRLKGLVSFLRNIRSFIDGTHKSANG